MVITLTGPNAYALKAELNKLRQGFIKEHGDLGVEKVDAASIDQASFSQLLASENLLANKKLVILENLSSNQNLSERIEQIIAEVPDSTDLILYEPKLDKRLRLYKTLQKDTDFKEYSELIGPALKKWINDYVATREGRIDSATIDYLIEQVGGAQQSIASELDKLLLYSSQITRESIDALVVASPQTTIFQLIEAALRGQAGRAISLYRQQRQAKVTPRELIALMSWQLHLLALVKSGGNIPASQIASQAGLNPYAVSKAVSSARHLSLTRIRTLIKQLLRIDLISKQANLDLDEAVEDYILKLAGLIA